MSAAKQAEQLKLGDDLASVISNETTVKVLVYLVDRAGSPTEIGEALGIPTPNASHHAKKLTRLGLVELLEKQEIRGAIKHIYRAVVRPIFETEEWGRLSLSERQRYSAWIIRMILADAAQSLNAEVFDEYPTRHLSRVPLLVDDKGLDEVAEVQKRALEEIFEIEATSAKRRLQSGEDGMHMLAAMMCFPLPGPAEGVVLEAHRESSRAH
ncbi:MAG TPA: winged helix-turn-helix domain-containing protein [Solirubrobacterales bacterium]|nr:winged helix-turn-helix domain-containing protein [Solirubrobacterales bacterium]